MHLGLYRKCRLSCFQVKEIDLLNFGIFVVRYRNGTWQFNTSGKEIHRELNEKFHLIENIHVERMYEDLFSFENQSRIF